MQKPHKTKRQSDHWLRSFLWKQPKTTSQNLWWQVYHWQDHLWRENYRWKPLRYNCICSLSPVSYPWGKAWIESPWAHASKWILHKFSGSWGRTGGEPQVSSFCFKVMLDVLSHSLSSFIARKPVHTTLWKVPVSTVRDEMWQPYNPHKPMGE